MKYLFIGLGSIGQRHLKNLKEIAKDSEIISFRSKKDNLEEQYPEYKIKQFFDIDEAFKEKPDVTFITNPTSLHMHYAIKAAENNSHIFIEKPISHNLEGIENLYSLCEKNKKTCFVAFCMRFHPNLIKIKELLSKNTIGKVFYAKINFGSYLPNWHPTKDYRKEYSALKELGGGVTLTLIHEIDYAYWLFGKAKSVTAIYDKVSNLEIDVEDTSIIVLKTESGTLVEINLDYIQQPPSRYCEIIGESGKITWDFFSNEVKVYLNEKKEWISFKEKFEVNDMYKEELKHFMDLVQDREKNTISKNEVMEVMKIVEASRKSAEQKKTILL